MPVNKEQIPTGLFIILAVLMTGLGLMVGWGLHMVMTEPMCASKPYDIFTQQRMLIEPGGFSNLPPCEDKSVARPQIVAMLIIFGVVAGVVPYTPPGKHITRWFVEEQKELDEEADIRAYFERYGP